MRIIDAVGLTLPGPTRGYYAVKKVFVKFFAKFFEVFAKFFKVFASFLRFSRAFRGFRIHSDPLGCIRMHSEAIGSVWTFSKIFEIFWIFESFFNVSGRNFYKRLFSRHNMALVSKKWKNRFFFSFFSGPHFGGFSETIFLSCFFLTEGQGPFFFVFFQKK